MSSPKNFDIFKSEAFTGKDKQSRSTPALGRLPQEIAFNPLAPGESTEPFADPEATEIGKSGNEIVKAGDDDGRKGISSHGTTIPSTTPNVLEVRVSRKHLDKSIPEKHTPAPVSVTRQQQTEETEADSSNDENRDPAKPPYESARKRADKAAFSEWITKKAKTIIEDDAKGMAGLQDSAQTTRSLMRVQASKVIIGDAREYQLELFERAKKENTIAVLDTGSGKTLIAVLLLKHILDQELEDRASGNAPRTAFFLVDCVTLVFQQSSVLDSNLSHKVECFCGDMNTDLFTQATWNKHFKENMVIVCTAEILNQCLMHSFITMDKINMLIFDEAHHTKKNHTYARIIKDYYLEAQKSGMRVPKIFGMTASPVDAKVDVVEAAEDLERLLHSRIATTAHPLQVLIKKPREILVEYEPPVRAYNTVLCEELLAKFGKVRSLSRLFTMAKARASVMGEWCADQIWAFALDEEEANRLERLTEQTFGVESASQSVEDLEKELRQIREAKEIVRRFSVERESERWEPKHPGNKWSPKVQRLVDLLEQHFGQETKSRCIVFVETRYTARLLKALFLHIGSSHLHMDILIGTRKGEIGDARRSFRQQVLTLSKFKSGDLNCLFATSIAEEGLDIPDCNIVIRFDMYKTLIQYIQSRGRARHEESQYITLVQRGSGAHIMTMSEVQRGEKAMRAFCEALPQDRLLQGNDFDVPAIEKAYRSFTEPTTGAKLTYYSSLGVLAQYAAALPTDHETVLQVTYIMGFEKQQFVCEVLLPEGSAFRSITGRPARSKAIAKRSAAFEACLRLRSGGHLDDRFLPTIQKQLPAMRNAHLALNLKKGNAYNMRVKPKRWERERGSIPAKLYMTVFDLEEGIAADESYSPLGLLSRSPLPQLPLIALHLQPRTTTNVHCISISQPLTVTNEKVESLTTFTLRIFKDIFNKTFESDSARMSYWLAPVDSGQMKSQASQLPGSLIDWKVLNIVRDNEEFKWTPETSNSEIEHRYMVDRWSGARRFFSQTVAPELKPTDPAREDAPKTSRTVMSSILDYTVSLFTKSRVRATWNPKQPVLLAQVVEHRRNLLDDQFNDEKRNDMAHICPEPLKISALPAAVARMAYLCPAILWRVDSFLIALEACDALGITCKPALALEAVTKDSDNTEEHRSEQIHVQRGMGKNYERLEFIGDCFLKMGTSISLYAQNAGDDEYDFHVKRMVMICNKNLFMTALANNLPDFVRTLAFNRRLWYPEGIKLLEGKGFMKSTTEAAKVEHHLNDKSVADVCEALIGASLLSYNETGDMDMAVRAVTVLVKNDDHKALCWDDYYKEYTKPAYQIAAATAAQKNLAQIVEQSHNYRFRYPRILRSAFTHPSYPFSWEKIPCYQRLEFLGDSLLDMACINFIFYRYPDRDPQWLTEHKMAMVSNKFLGALCVRLKFHKHLQMNSSQALGGITDYVSEIAIAEEESNGARDYWTMTAKNPPKCLPDMVESYIGAIFVDSEFDYREVERFFEEHIRWFFEDMSIYDLFANAHPTTHLQNLLSAELGCMNFRIMSDSLPALLPGSAERIIAVVMVHGTVISDSSGASSKYAKIRAAQKAIEILEGMPKAEFEKRFRCECVLEGKDVPVLDTAV